MIVVAPKIRFRAGVPGAPHFGKREWNALLRACWTAVGVRWFEAMLARHFTKEGGREYGYQLRQGEAAGTAGKSFWRSYTGRKLKKYGHTDPLVFTGELRDRTLRQANVQPIKNGVRVALTGAQKANLRRSENAPNMADELVRYTPDEVQQLSDLFHAEVDRRMRDWPGESEVTI